MHSSVGIAIGRSNHTNGMIFWDPVTQRMNVSADYKLDPTAAIGTQFPTVLYDGQISPLFCGGRQSTKEPFPPGTQVQVQLEEEYFAATVQSVPIEPDLPHYHVTFADSPDSVAVPIEQLFAMDEPISPLIADDSEDSPDDVFPTLPTWIAEDTHVTLFQDGHRQRGTISSTDSGWVFQQRTASGRVTFQQDLADLPVTWKDRLSTGTFQLGWQEAKRAYHVSAKGLKQGAPASFQRSMRKENPDRRIWIDLYLEEAGGLKEQDTYSVLTGQQYTKDYSNIQVIPLMCVQTVKPDENGDPICAKS
jgi:hypothetical protein